MKRVIALIFITIFGLITVIDSGYAGPRHRVHRGSGIVEGIIIGTAATILGAAIITEINNQSKHYNPSPVYERRDSYDRYDRYDRHDRHDRYDRYNRHDRRERGYWSFEKVWVPPVYRQKWYPGHYSRRGHWIPGGYDRILVREGYWETKRVWVRN